MTSHLFYSLAPCSMRLTFVLGPTTRLFVRQRVSMLHKTSSTQHPEVVPQVQDKYVCCVSILYVYYYLAYEYNTHGYQLGLLLKMPPNNPMTRLLPKPLVELHRDWVC